MDCPKLIIILAISWTINARSRIGANTHAMYYILRVSAMSLIKVVLITVSLSYLPSYTANDLKIFTTIAN